MRFGDVSRLALENLWRTRLRTVLTTLGVVIGIGALVSMVSFGSGLQHNIAREFRELELFTSIQVLPGDIDLSDPIASGMHALEGDVVTLDDETLEAIRTIPGVRLAYPEVSFPARLTLDDGETETSVRALPSELGEFKPFSELPYGRFFDSNEEAAIVVSQNLLEDMGIRLTDVPDPARRAREDTTRTYRMLHSSEVLGRSLTLHTSVIDAGALMRSITKLEIPTGDLPIREEETVLTIVGILERSGGFSGLGFGGQAIIPSGTAEGIPRLAVTSVWDLLGGGGGASGYSSISVRVESMKDLDAVGQAIEDMGLSTLTIADQLEEVRSAFVIMDALLGAVGTIALFVAGLGIANTMVTSILERTREIGVMKAIGGGEWDIRRIFFVEAAVIGLMGGVLGLLLGWLVTRLANVIANAYIRPYGVAATNLFYMPLWLTLGAVGFSVVVSLLAGIYPAARAARVDPVTALRHD
jgi:putative ABC transport system permease protein